jgi:hypothetical protein
MQQLVGCRKWIKSCLEGSHSCGIHAPGLRQQNKRVSILDRDGEEVTEPEQVVEVFRQHYETLGQLTSATFDEGHSQHVAQAVAQWASDEGQRVNAKHDGAFTAKEIEEAVKDLPTYKAGDSDELKSELIKAGGTAMETLSYSTGCGLAKSCPQPGPRES